MSRENLRRYALTVAAFVLGSCMIGGWLQANVQEWAKASGQDQYIVKYAGLVVDSLVTLTQSAPFFAITWATIGGTVLLWIEFAIRRWTNKGHPDDTAKRWDDSRHAQRPIPPLKQFDGPKDDLPATPEAVRQAIKIINLQVSEAQRTIKEVCLGVVEEVRERGHFALFLRRGVIEYLEEQEGRLLRIAQGVLVPTGTELQYVFVWYWEQYRLARQFILEAADAGMEIRSSSAWSRWVEADRKLLTALQDFQAEPENSEMRRAIDWEDQVTRRLYGPTQQA